MLHILIVDSDPAEKNAGYVERTGKTVGETYANALAACRDDLTFTIIAPYDGDPLPDLGAFDGAVFTGSSVDWNTQDTRAAPLAKAMERVFAEGLPTLGSCNGMQLAASVLGGDCAASPNGREDGLAQQIALTPEGQTHPFLAGRQNGYAAPCVHRDEVQRLPEGAVLLAGNAHSPVQAFAYEQDGIRFWGVQYHPELDPQVLAPSLAQGGLLSPEVAQDLADAATDAEAAARLGLRNGELAADTRQTELRNWLNSL